MKRHYLYFPPYFLSCLKDLPFLPFFLFLIILTFAVSSSHGAEICVSTTDELKNALYGVASGELGIAEDTVFKIQQGIYQTNPAPGGSGGIYATFTGGFNITVEGGYTAGCLSRVVDPDNTIIDGTNGGRPLSIQNNEGGNISIDGLTLRNATVGGDGAGLYLRAYQPLAGPERAGDITVSNCKILSNTINDAPGNGASGAGIFAESASHVEGGIAGSITILDNIVYNNSQFDTERLARNGAGVYAASYAWQGLADSVSIEGNTFYGNIGLYGAGAYAMAYGLSGTGDISIINNTATANQAVGGDGAGIYAHSHAIEGESGNITIEDNSFEDNLATTYNLYSEGKGAGVFAHTWSVDSGRSGVITVSDNLFRKNRGVTGGGLYIEVGSASEHSDPESILVRDNRIIGNIAERDGGGAWASSFTGSGSPGDVTFVGNIVVGNKARATVLDGDGAGIYVRLSTGDPAADNTATFTNNTIAKQNSEPATGPSGLYVTLESGSFQTLELYNNIVFDNGYNDIYLNAYSASNSVNVQNNDFSSLYPYSLSNPADNINEDPQLRNPGEWADNNTPADPSDDYWEDGEDYRLMLNSPCIDAGTDTAPSFPAFDFQGDTRVLDGNGDGSSIPDIGADEFTVTLTDVIQGLILLSGGGMQSSMPGDIDGDTRLGLAELIYMLEIITTQ